MEKKKVVKKTTIHPDLAKIDSTSRVLSHQITKAAMSGNRPEVKRLKSEMVNLDKKAMAHPANQPTRFKKK